VTAELVGRLQRTGPDRGSTRTPKLDTHRTGAGSTARFALAGNAALASLIPLLQRSTSGQVPIVQRQPRTMEQVADRRDVPDFWDHTVDHIRDLVADQPAPLPFVAGALVQGFEDVAKTLGLFSTVLTGPVGLLGSALIGTIEAALRRCEQVTSVFGPRDFLPEEERIEQAFVMILEVVGVGHVFASLAEQDPITRMSLIREGFDGGRSYVRGWVPFSDLGEGFRRMMVRSILTGSTLPEPSR